MDMTKSIEPKSDQLNAEDLLTGPRTFTIDRVTAGNAEQPVHVHLVEFPGRPFKPSKTVRRLMVAAWGKETSVYAGRRMTLYRDPTVRFGGQDVGGIRVSHMSDLKDGQRIVIALTVTRGKRAPYVVEPLPDVVEPMTAEQSRALGVAFEAAGVDRPARLDYCTQLVQRPLTNAGDLTSDEAARIIDALERDAAHLAIDLPADGA